MRVFVLLHQPARCVYFSSFTCVLGLIFKEGCVVVSAQGSEKGVLLFPKPDDLQCHTTTFTVTAVTVSGLAHKAALLVISE